MKRSLVPTSGEHIALVAVGLLFAGLLGYALYKVIVTPARTSTSAADNKAGADALVASSDVQDVAQGFDSRKQAVAAAGRENPQAIKNPIPWFTSRTMEGFKCVRCSDTGAHDNVVGDDATLPVMEMCSAQKQLQWDRSQAWRNTMTQLGYEIGNYILNENADATLGPESCRRKCDQINKGEGGVKYGTCDAFSYDKVAGRCHYFFNCDQVVPDKNFMSEFVGAWNVNKQPEVLNFHSKYP